MAEDQSAKKKRRVRNPETFRQRAEKAQKQAESGKPKPVAKAADTGKKVTGPFRQLIAKFFNWKPVKLIGKVIVPSYFRGSWSELKLVTWPNWKESRQLTFAVLVFAVVFGAAIAGVDWGLDKIFKNILLK